MFRWQYAVSLWLGAVILGMGGRMPAAETASHHPSNVEFSLDGFQAAEGDSTGLNTAGTPDQSCELVSTPQRTFPTQQVLRGNLYRMDSPGILLDYAIELTFAGTADLYFTVLQRPITDPESAYSRHPQLPEDLVVQATGLSGQRRLFSTNGRLPPLLLEGGREYILAIGWGNATIGNYRNSPVANLYPEPFSHGEVMGSVSLFMDQLLGEPPIMIPPGGLQFVSVDRDAANHMQLCFEPELGACCCAGQLACAELLERECEEANGFFRGERVACTETLCRCGACCLQCRGECVNDVEEASCQTILAGEWQGPGAQCSDAGVDCPVVVGACCVLGRCRETCREECLISSGVFNADLLCTPDNPCSGACCSVPDGECLDDISRETCLSIGGTPKDLDTSCATLEGTDECGGACCRPNGRCNVVSNRLRCELELGGTYVGDATPCPATIPNQEALCAAVEMDAAACCIFNGDCLVAAADFCSQPWIGGVYFSNESVCDPSLCAGLPRGACCYRDGSCEPGFTSPDCVHDGGRYGGDGTVCGGNVCSQPTGACCRPTGACEPNRTAQQCAVGGGSYRGDGSVCIPSAPCPAPTGACCFADRFCEQHTMANCAAQGGMFRGIGASCSLCDEVVGACCLPDGACETATRSSCLGREGVYRGDGTTCDDIECPRPMGACCFADGRPCSVLTMEACTTSQGTYRGDDTTCQPNLCPGACCFAADGRCERRDSTFLCAGLGGVFQGADTTCSPNPCPAPTGACCLGDGVCEVLTEATCDEQGGDYEGNNTVCSPNPCPQPPRAACCFDNETCQVLTEPACEEADGLYLDANYPTCEAGTCQPPPPGACCLPTGECIETGRPACRAVEGVFRGVFTECPEVNDCPQPMGACCYSDERECAVTTDDACTADGGAFWGIGTACEPSPCVRACCLPDSTCAPLNEAKCEAQRGVYFATFADCSDKVFCAISGACCFDGVCEVRTGANCAESEGEYRGDGTDCLPNACLEIFAAVPGNNAVDPLQPSELDGTNPAGWTSLLLTMNGDAVGATASDFAVTIDPKDGAAPMVSEALVAGPMVTLMLNQPIPPGHWTRIRYLPSGSGTCLGFLPGDVLQDRSFTVQDVAGFPVFCLDQGKCTDADVDRSMATNPQDLARLVDLYNGADEFDVWGGESLPPSPCDEPIGACCIATFCTVGAESECSAPEAVFQGGGTECDPNPCLTIVSATPPNNAVIAEDTEGPAVIEIGLVFNGPIYGELSPEDFEVTVSGGDVVPVLQSAKYSGERVALRFAEGPLPSAAWLTVSYVGNGSRTCLGFLAADVSGDGTASADDVVELIGCLDRDETPCPSYRCDLDGSDACNNQDLIRSVDVLNAAAEPAMLPPSPCP